jgi:integrase
MFSVFLKNCIKNGYCENSKILKKNNLKIGNNDDLIALTEKEVKQIKELKTDDNLSIIKDLFLLQIQTMLRFSDLINLKKENIDLETQELKLWQLKTSAYLRIPLSTQSIEMISKYKEFPKMKHGNYIASIKRLCRFAGVDTPTENVIFIGKQRISEIVPKYKLIGTHTARRTGITLLLTRGLPADIIIKISGHKDINSFQKYVRITQDAAVNTVRSAWGGD